jgi:hypothetical protein
MSQTPTFPPGATILERLELQNLALWENRRAECPFTPDLDNPEYCVCGWHRAAHRTEVV